jgi:hypothetical protein
MCVLVYDDYGTDDYPYQGHNGRERLRMTQALYLYTSAITGYTLNYTMVISIHTSGN